MTPLVEELDLEIISITKVKQIDNEKDSNR